MVAGRAAPFNVIGPKAHLAATAGGREDESTPEGASEEERIAQLRELDNFFMTVFLLEMALLPIKDFLDLSIISCLIKALRLFRKRENLLAGEICSQEK
jgi:hypothetical protein